MTVARTGAWAELLDNWQILLASMLGFGLGLSGLPFYTLSVFVDPLRSSFGWSVGTIQGGLMVSYLTSMVSLPLVGRLANRFGPRRVAVAALGFYGLAYMSLSLQSGVLWHYYCTWFVIALFGTGTLAITWTRTLTQVLFAGRGLGLGLALLGSGLVAMVGPGLAQLLVEAFGWRTAFACLGALPILIALPAALLWFRADGRVAAVPTGLPVDRGDHRVWLLGAVFVVFAAGTTGLVPNLVKIITEHGLDRSQAVAAAGALGIFVILGRVGCGALVDRFWAPGVAAGFLFAAVAACAFLAVGDVGPRSAAVAAACIGLALGAEFDLMPFLVSRFLPERRYTSSLALVSACFYLGAAVSAPLIAWSYDRFGSYHIGLTISMTLLSLAAFGLLALRGYPAPSDSAVLPHAATT